MFFTGLLVMDDMRQDKIDDAAIELTNLKLYQGYLDESDYRRIFEQNDIDYDELSSSELARVNELIDRF